MRVDLIERLEVALVNMEYALADARQDMGTHPKADEIVIGWRQANIRGASEAEQIAFSFTNEVMDLIKATDETYAAVKATAERLGKTAVEVNDSPGFASNRILMPMINEAIYASMEGVATPAAIDEVFKLGMSHPMGPLALADLIGLDVCRDIMMVLYESFHDSKYRPCPLLQKMVAAGWLGCKTQRGFYTYPREQAEGSRQ